MRHAILLTLLLAACADEAPKQEPTPPVTTAPRSTAPPERVAPPENLPRGGVVTELLPIPEIEGLPTAPGSWVERDGGEGLVALYGQPRSGAVFSIRCDRSTGDIVIRRSGERGADVTLLTDRGTNLFGALSTGEQPATTARFRATFPWFEDTLAKAEGRIGVRVEKGVPLVIPAHPAIGRVLADCTRWQSRG